MLLYAKAEREKVGSVNTGAFLDRVKRKITGTCVASFRHLFSKLKYGKVSQVRSVLRKGRSCIYKSTHDCGFFSNTSTSLRDILLLHRLGITVKRVDFSEGMSLFKDKAKEDVYSRYFTHGDKFVPFNLQFNPFDAHKHYRDLPVPELSAAVYKWFSPSTVVMDRAKSMILENGGIEPEKTIAIYYRGTDKSTEVTLAPIQAYIEVADRLIAEAKSHYTILIQTDQEQARDTVMEHFGDRARYFADLPVTRGKHWYP